jgi:hypothetical protein
MLTIHPYRYRDGRRRYAIYANGAAICVFDSLSAALDALELMEDCE